VVRAGETRQRMLRSAVALLQRRAASGVSIDAVLAHSGAPRGSVYHHFPGGREEMIGEAVRLAGDHIATVLERADTTDPCAVVRSFVTYWKQVLTESDYRAGCPVLALAVDRSDERGAADEIVRDVFVRWHTTLRTLFVTCGVAPERAGSLAHLCVAAAEGAVVLSRARASVQPLDDVADELCAALAWSSG
jgi:TetR/AcrR family transcriptional regulator, lmrAB and yxaGH operons repressor